MLIEIGSAGGYFWGCSGFPSCDGISPIVATRPGKTKDAKPTQIECPDCGKAMAERKGKHGKFLGCTGYPECSKILPIEMTKTRRGAAKYAARSGAVKGTERSKKCPKCGSIMSKRKGPKGAFWGCSAYPDCKYTEDVGKRK